MINWIKVWVHCSWKLFTFQWKPAHRMCDIRYPYWYSCLTKDKCFCSCGYNNNGITWEQEIEKWIKE